MVARDISISVSPDVASAYTRASEDDREFAIAMFGSSLKRRSRTQAVADLIKIQHQLSEQAERTGLTPENLESILAEKE